MTQVRIMPSNVLPEGNSPDRTVQITFRPLDFAIPNYELPVPTVWTSFKIGDNSKTLDLKPFTPYLVEITGDRVDRFRVTIVPESEEEVSYSDLVLVRPDSTRSEDLKETVAIVSLRVGGSGGGGGGGEVAWENIVGAPQIEEDSDGMLVLRETAERGGGSIRTFAAPMGMGTTVNLPGSSFNAASSYGAHEWTIYRLDETSSSPTAAIIMSHDTINLLKIEEGISYEGSLKLPYTTGTVATEEFVQESIEDIPAPVISWGGVQGKPSTFTPSTHQHPIADITGLQVALDEIATLRAEIVDLSDRLEALENATPEEPGV